MGMTVLGVNEQRTNVLALGCAWRAMCESRTAPRSTNRTARPFMSSHYTPIDVTSRLGENSTSALVAEVRHRERARIWAGMPPKKSTGVEVILFSAFGDESHDEKQARVFAVAAVVGREPDWQAAETEWLKHTGGECISAARLEYEKRRDTYKVLTRVLVNSRLGAYGVALDLIAFKKWFPELELNDVGYYSCFMQVVQWLAVNVAARFNEPIEFTFHIRQKSDFNAGMLYDVMANDPEIKENVFIENTIKFTSDLNPRIQMADLVARETMKSLDNLIVRPDLDPRRSTTALCTEGRTHIDLLSEDFCRGWRGAIDRVGVGEDYASWLDDNKLADNMSNRIRYMGWINKSILHGSEPVWVKKIREKGDGQ